MNIYKFLFNFLKKKVGADPSRIILYFLFCYNQRQDYIMDEYYYYVNNIYQHYSKFSLRDKYRKYYYQLRNKTDLKFEEEKKQLEHFHDVVLLHCPWLRNLELFICPSRNEYLDKLYKFILKLKI